MPLYEYEHVYDDCPIAGTRFAVVQSLDEAALEFCPSCGLEVRRVVSKANISLRGEIDPERAAKHGYTTWRKAGTGVWEKIAGPGVDVIADPDRL